MLDQMSDAQKKAFYETARREAMLQSQHDPKDTQALTRWGGALLELANFEPGEQASRMAEEAAGKFKSALRIDPRKHEALWCLGNAYTTLGFLSADKSTASGLFTQAKDCFSNAVREQPENDIYKKGLEMTKKAPELYDEIQKQMYPTRAPVNSGSKFWFNVLGYVTVIGAVMVVSTMVGAMSPQAQAAAQQKSA